MADFNFSDVASKIEPPKGMSLSEMVNMARNAQAYQQAGQINPLVLRQQLAETEYAEQNKPQLLRRSAAETKLAEDTLEPKIARAKSESELASTQSQSAKFKLSGEKLDKVMQIIGARATDPEVIKLSNIASNPQSKSEDKQAAKERLHELNAVDMDNAIKAGLTINEALQNFGHITSKIETKPNEIPGIFQNAVRMASGSQNQLGLQTPKTGVNAAGQTTAVNPVTGQYGVMGTPETNPMSARSQTMTDPVSGDTMVFDLDAKGNPTNVRFLKNFSGANSSQGAKGPLPEGMLGIGGNVGMGNPNVQQANKPQQVPQGSTAETIKAQAANAMNSYINANSLLTDNSKPGHIPTQEYVAKSLLSYLKDPKVETGPIADFLAKKTNKESLTPKQMEIVKLLQQRIQNLSPRTDADASNKADAYGSFGMKKEALIDLVRRDIGQIHNQKMLANGLIHSAGDPSQPNLNAVNQFQNQFSQYSQNPILMNYMGIVGTGKSANIDNEDEKALKKLFFENKLTKDQIKELEQQRKSLVQMSGVQ